MDTLYTHTRHIGHARMRCRAIQHDLLFLIMKQAAKHKATIQYLAFTRKRAYAVRGKCP